MEGVGSHMLIKANHTACLTQLKSYTQHTASKWTDTGTSSTYQSFPRQNTTLGYTLPYNVRIILFQQYFYIIIIFLSILFKSNHNRMQFD